MCAKAISGDGADINIAAAHCTVSHVNETVGGKTRAQRAEARAYGSRYTCRKAPDSKRFEDLGSQEQRPKLSDVAARHVDKLRHARISEPVQGGDE